MSEELLLAAKAVVDSWEKGNLGQAVCRLSLAVERVEQDRVERQKARFHKGIELRRRVHHALDEVLPELAEWVEGGGL